MTIEHKNYIMESDKEGGFHLYQKVVRTKEETGEQYDDISIIGYNMQLDSCIKKMVHLNHCDREEKISLGQYIKLYRESINEIKNLIKI